MDFLAWDPIRQDFRYGIRLLARNRGAAFVAVLSLGLAIGANLAAFGLLNAVILRPLPVSDPDKLITLTMTFPDARGAVQENDSFNYPLFRRLRDSAAGKASLFGVSYQGTRKGVIDSSREEEPVRAQWVSGNTFEQLGIGPQVGRVLRMSDESKSSVPVAVLSHSYWQRRFQKNPDVLGRWIRMGAQEFQIVGVAAEGFWGIEVGVLTDVWFPITTYNGGTALDQPNWSWFRVMGRLAPGITSGNLEGAVQGIYADHVRERVNQFRPDEPKERRQRVLASRMHARPAAAGPSGLRKDLERPLWVLLLLVGLVLLIACSNVANLLLAQAAARRREMALRVSLGAGRSRLIRQVLIECAMLAIAAGLLGATFSTWAAPAVIRYFAPSSQNVWLDLRPDWRVFLFLMTICGSATLLFGLAPALRSSRVSPQQALKADSRQSLGAGYFRPLLGAQVAICFLVLFLSGLFLSTFGKLTSLDPGFNAANLLIVDLEAADFRETQPSFESPAGAGSARSAAWKQLADRVAQSPGIQSVSLSSWGLFSGSSWRQGVRISGRAADTESVFLLAVSPGFFDTMGMTVKAGRDFTHSDTEATGITPVAVNEAFVHRYFPGEQPLGRQFDRTAPKGKLETAQIVAVVNNAKYATLREKVEPTIYVPYRGSADAAMEIRTTLDPQSVLQTVKQQAAGVSGSFKVVEFALQAKRVQDTLVRERLLAVLSAFFAVLAAVLAGIGLYGMLSYSVVRRTKEIGIRMALGATAQTVTALVGREIIWLTLAGLIIGVLSGLASGRLVESLLYEVRPTDWRSVALPAFAILVCAGVAAIVPVVRALRVNPVNALRYE